MADITLSVGIKQSVLTKSIQDAIKAAQQQGLTVKVTADVEALKKSIEKLPKIAIEVNKKTFSSSVAAAVKYTNELKNMPKLQIKVDEKYLRQQVANAIKGMGTTPGSGSTTGGGGVAGGSNEELQRLKEIEAQTRLVTRGYSELNRVRTTLKNIQEGSFEARGLTENHIALNQLVDDFKNGKISAEQYRQSLAEISGVNAGFIDSAKEANQYANSFSDKLQKFKMHLTTVSSIIRAFRMLSMVIRPIVNAVTEVDTALTQLRIVTQANDQAIQSYADNINKIADRTAGSVKDLINSTTTFARLGYSLDESSTLAQYTQMLENVGDIDESSATSAMTAIVKAYGVGADELELVMDKLVDVGNHFPISVRELAEGMNNAGSMLAVATEGSFDKSIALLTAANTTIQNISKSSTGLRTIAARIRNVGTELDDLGETMTEVEYDEIVRALTDNGVSLTNQNGELRELYDILADLSKGWADMSANEQAALAKTLSGTRQQNVFISLMSNFEEASGAMRKMEGSEGALKQANDVYLESIKAHIQQMKNAFVDFSQSAIAAETVKDFAELAESFLKLASGALKFINIIGGLKTVIPLVTSLLAILKGQVVVASVNKIVSSFKTFGTSIKNVFSSGSLSARTFEGSLAGVETQAASTGIAINSMLGVVGLLITAITAVVGAINSAIDSYNTHLKNIADEGEEAGKNIEGLLDSYSEYLDVSQNTASTSEQVADAQAKLRKELGMTGLEFEQASQRAGSYEEALRSALVEQIRLQVETEKAGLNAQRDSLLGFMLPGIKNTRLFADKMFESQISIGDSSWISKQLGISKEQIEDLDYVATHLDEIGAKVSEIIDYYGTDGQFGSVVQATKNWYDSAKTYLSDYAAEVQKTQNNMAILASYTVDPQLLKDLDEMRARLKELGGNELDTRYGNINTNFRQVLEWNNENIEKYKEALLSWGYDLKDIEGTISTVMGSSAEYDGIEIAFSPILQTPNGPVLLSNETVDNYIFSLISKAGEGWTSEDLFALDLTGLDIDGQHIKGLLAEIGDGAIEAGEAMHYLGKDGAISQTFEEYRQALVDATEAETGFRWETEDAERAVDEFLLSTGKFDVFFQAADMYINRTGELAKGLEGLQLVADRTSTALTGLDEALKGDDWDTNQEKRIDYYSKLLEEMNAGNFGGKHYAALARAFNVDLSQPIEKQIEQIQTLSKYYTDLDSGMVNFLDDVSSLVSSDVATWNADQGLLWWDPSKMKEFADALGISKDMLADMLNTFRMGVKPSDWITLEPEQLRGWLEYDNLIAETDDGLSVNKARLEAIAKTYGFTYDEILSKLKDIDEYREYFEDGLVTELSLKINPDSSVDEATAQINEWFNSVETQSASAQDRLFAISSALSELDAESVKEILLNLDLPEEDIERIKTMLPEELRSQLDVESDEANEKLRLTRELAEKAIQGLLAFDDIDAEATVSLKGANDVITTLWTILGLLAQVNTGNAIGNAAAMAGYSAFAPHAKGTKHAAPGLSLLGDEYSASGTPKPELVISDGMAYLAGVDGPVVQRLKAGDIVYTYRETKKILGNNLGAFNGIPAFASGINPKYSTTGRLLNNNYGVGTSSYSSSSGYGSGSSSSASTSGSGDNWFEQQYELHNHYRKLDQETDQAYLTWLVGAWKQAYAQGIIELKDAHKYEEEAYKLMKDIAADAFKEEYQYHQHMLNMDQESDQEYYSWLEWRHQVAYTNNEITLDEYYKYQEEVYKKSKELIKDYFNDVDHKISMLENANKSDIEIIQWDEKGMEYAEERIAELIKEGKDNNDANVQEQQKTWWSYYKDRAKREEDTTKNAKSAAKELIDYRIKMLKQELSKEKDTLNDRLSAIKDFYSKQKELLQDRADEDKYLDEQAEKRKKVSDLEIQLAQIEYDNSAWAQKKRLELSQQLLDAQKDLNEFEKEHALQVAKEKLDAIQEMQEQEIQTQIDAVEKASQTEADLYNRALADIQNGGEDLYNQMVAFNNVEGSGNPEDIAEMWDDAYTSLKKYKEMFGEYYKDIKLSYGSDISPAIVDTSKIEAGINPVKPDLESKGPPPAVTAQATVQQPATQSKPQAKADPAQGQKVRLKSNGKLATNSYNSPTLTPASWVIGRDLYIQAAYPGRNAPYHIGTTANINDGASTWVGWVDKWQLEGYASGTRNALAGIHRINEKGDEALFKTADGGTYRLFSGGEHVFNAGATDFLHNFADNPVGILTQLLSSIGAGIGQEIKNNNMSQNISLGDIYIQGNATEKTVSEIRREKRAEIDYMLKELNRLSK